MGADEKPLWEKVLGALGFNTTRLRWKLMQRQERARRAENARENKQRAYAYKHKTCSSCGELVAGDERRCPHCDARLSGPLASRIKRALRLVVPEGTYTYTSALVALNIAFYLAM
ncbi:MAG: hypothetical protein KC503_21785, partial [Myxococcales bacterium]|nr:hypothetical protein [Myxococcales bacterium]